jgi:hypothetical protein
VKQVRILTLLGWLIFLSHWSYAQVKIGGDPSVIQASSILELEASDRGLLIPRMSELQRDSISSDPGFDPAISHGLVVYNTEDACINFYDSTGSGSWKNMCRVYLPMTDTSSARKRGAISGDVIVDSDCDCIMILDTTGQWKPLNQRGGFQDVEIGGDSVYLLSVAANNGDTLVFTHHELLGIGMSNPDYSIDVLSRDSLLVRLSKEGFEVLTIESALIGGDSVTLIASPGQPIVMMADIKDSSKYIMIDTNGAIDISQYGRGTFGTKSPSYLLGVDSAGNLVEFTGFTAISSSDLRLKRDVRTLESEAEKLYQLRGVKYYWRTDVHPVKVFDHELNFGVVAQEVEKLYPNLVSTDNQGYKMVNYMALVPLLIENQRRQYEQIQQLQTKLSEMEKRLIRLEQLMEEDQE